MDGDKVFISPDALGKSVTNNEDAYVYHIKLNTLGQRGVPLLLPDSLLV